MTHASISQFPLELIEEIIDQLSDDANALQTCSTVSRAWMKRSRYHLFSTFRVRTNTFTDFTNFLPNSQDAHKNQPDTRPPLTDAVLSTVRVLYLGGKSYGLKPLLTLGSLQAILRALPNLRRLHLNTIRLDVSQFVPSTKPRALDELALVSVDASSASSDGGELLALLSLFSRIDSLFLRFVHFNDYPVTTADAQEHPTILASTLPHFPSKLEVRDLRLHIPRHTVFFLELFKRTPTRRTLRSLYVTSRATEKFEAIGSFCKNADIGRSLEKLEVDLKYCIPRTSVIMTHSANLLTSYSWYRKRDRYTASVLHRPPNSVAGNHALGPVPHAQHRFGRVQHLRHHTPPDMCRPA